MSITEKVYQALRTSKELTSQFAKDRKGRCIYHSAKGNRKGSQRESGAG